MNFMANPREQFFTNKRDVYQIDDTLSFYLLDLTEYSPEKNREDRVILVAIDNFSKVGFKTPS